MTTILQPFPHKMTTISIYLQCVCCKAQFNGKRLRLKKAKDVSRCHRRVKKPRAASGQGTSAQNTSVRGTSDASSTLEDYESFQSPMPKSAHASRTVSTMGSSASSENASGHSAAASSQTASGAAAHIENGNASEINVTEKTLSNTTLNNRTIVIETDPIDFSVDWQPVGDEAELEKLNDRLARHPEFRGKFVSFACF